MDAIVKQTSVIIVVKNDHDIKTTLNHVQGSSTISKVVRIRMMGSHRLSLRGLSSS